MAARTLNQIVKELNTADKPRVTNLQKQKSLIPGQIKSQEQGLKAQQTQAFDEILGGARRRGLGFSGIPLAEQADYTSTYFLPELARLKQQGNQQRLSLEEAILGIRADNTRQAQSIRESELNRAEQIRQFNENLRYQREQAARQAAAARAAAAQPTFGSFGASLGQSTQQGSNYKTPRANALQQSAYNDVRTRINSQSDSELQSDYFATASSAKYGNQRDLLKLALYRQLRPDLFKREYSWERTGGVTLANNPTF